MVDSEEKKSGGGFDDNKRFSGELVRFSRWGFACLARELEIMGLSMDAERFLTLKSISFLFSVMFLLSVLLSIEVYNRV